MRWILDWPAKLRLLDGFRQREGLGWSAPRLALIDLQYSDVRLDKGLYNRLVAWGSMKRLIDEAQVTAAISNPPADTRAYFRGSACAASGADIAAASWDSVIFDLGGDSLIRIPTLEPLRGSPFPVGELLDSVDSAAALVDELTAKPGSACPCSDSVEFDSCEWRRHGAGTETIRWRRRRRRARARRLGRSERREKLAEDTDDLLDEIDDVLEENAEDFVRAYVQKGGQ